MATLESPKLLDIVTPEESAKIEVKPYTPPKVESFDESKYSYLLEKPEMMTKDKEWMQKAIKLLVDTWVDTQENINKLDAIVYASNYIEIWGVKRAREDVKAPSMFVDNQNVFQYGDETYFTFNSLELLDKYLDQQGNRIPSLDDYKKSLQSLPDKWAILGIVTNMSMLGSFKYDIDKDEYRYAADTDTLGTRWTTSPSLEYYNNEANYDNAYSFLFSEDHGFTWTLPKTYALPVRSILK